MVMVLRRQLLYLMKLPLLFPIKLLFTMLQLYLYLIHGMYLLIDCVLAFFSHFIADEIQLL